MTTRCLALVAMATLARPVPAGAADAPRPVTVVVTDPTGATVRHARVVLRTAAGSTVATGLTDEAGRYATQLSAGGYLVEVNASGFGERREVLEVSAEARDLKVVLGPPRIEEEVTVTATPGLVQSVDTAAQQVNVIDQEEIALRAAQVVAQVATEEPGLALQRTSQVMSGIFIRGLTGNKVNVYVDGIRYTHAGQRGGVNTFLNLTDPASLEGVEVLRGPSSAQYGSDALGGSVQFLTRMPAIGGRGVDGRWSVAGGTVDRSYGTSLNLAGSSPRTAWTATVSGRRFGDLRPGGGIDSHSAVTRFLGLPSGLVMDGRLPGTGFDQYGGNLKVAWAPTGRSQVTASYTRAQQDRGQRYDQLLGGDGNLVADLRNLMLDFAYLRWETRAVAGLDHVSLGYSFNTQREERVNQGGNGNPRANVNHEYERTSVHGLQAGAVRRAGRHALGAGADAYFEGVEAPSFSFNPATGAIAVRRGRVPDGAGYRTLGLYLQDQFEAGSRLTLVGNLRLSHFAYESRAAASPLVNGRPLWPDDELSLSDLTYRVGAVARATDELSLSTSVSRGFRAPHVTDLATLGLTGDGFEVAAPDVAGLGGRYGSSALPDATDTGRAVEQLGSERSLNLEASLRWRNARFDTDLAVFRTTIRDNLTKQALILPPGAVGAMLGDQPITRQDPNGVVYVPVTAVPVLVRANFDDATLWGVEHSLRVQLAEAWTLSSAATYLRAEDDRTGRPPNIEGGTPAPDGWLKLRYARGQGRRFWVEPYLHVALDQDRLSSLDLSDRRIGATRSRSGIASFFQNGARARGLVGNGPDGQAGTADDVLLATGETLAQVQQRVLGSATSAPLYTRVDGYAVLGVRGGVRLGGRHEVVVDAQNLTDENYRGVSWGVDAPGRGVYLRYQMQF